MKPLVLAGRFPKCGLRVIIRKGVRVSNGCVLGDHVKVNNDVSLAKGVSVCLSKEVSESVLTPKNTIWGGV